MSAAPQEALRVRLGAFKIRLAGLAQMPAPEVRQNVRELLQEFDALQRQILAAASPPPPPPVPSRETPAQPAHAAIPTRTLPEACGSCGGPIVVELHRRGRLPRRCQACRGDLAPSDPNVRGARNRASYREAHPAPGLRKCAKCKKSKPDDDDNFRLKDPRTGMRDSYCRPCRGEYAANRYARVGYKVAILELCDGDIAVGYACPDCGHPFLVGERVQGENLRHVECPAVS